MPELVGTRSHQSFRKLRLLSDLVEINKSTSYIHFSSSSCSQQQSLWVYSGLLFASRRWLAPSELWSPKKRELKRLPIWEVSQSFQRRPKLWAYFELGDNKQRVLKLCQGLALQQNPPCMMSSWKDKIGNLWANSKGKPNFLKLSADSEVRQVVCLLRFPMNISENN